MFFLSSRVSYRCMYGRMSCCLSLEFFFFFFSYFLLSLKTWPFVRSFFVLRYGCMVTHGHTYSKSMDQPGKVANLARGQLNSENEYFPVPVRA